MAAFYCGKRHWESHKGLLSQIHDENLPIATSEDLMELLSDSFGLMLETKPLGNVLDESQVQKLELFIDTNIPFIFFCSTLKDLLITKAEWIFTIPSSNCKGTIEEVVEEAPKKKTAKKGKSNEEVEEIIPSWNEILGDSTEESKQQKKTTASFNSHATKVVGLKKPVQTSTNTQSSGRLLRHNGNVHNESDSDELFDDDDDGSTTMQRGNMQANTKLSTPSLVPKFSSDTSSMSNTTRQQSPQQDSLHQIGKNNSAKTSTSSSKQGKYASNPKEINQKKI